MATITQICREMQAVLCEDADRLGWQTGFQRRKSKMGGSAFMQALVMSSLASETISYTRLTNSALDAGVQISAQGLDQRFGKASAELAQRVLAVAVGRVIEGQPAALPLLERFAGVYVRDSSVISLPATLSSRWPGVGSRAGETATVKLQIRLEICSGQLVGPVLQAGCTADSRSPFQEEELPRRTVRMGDLGYFSLDRFVRDQRQGVYTFSRFKIGTRVYDLDGQDIDVLAWLQMQRQGACERRVYLGKSARFPCRLIAIRVPQEMLAGRLHKLQEYARKKQVTPQPQTLALAAWTLLVTDIPAELLSIPDALVLLAVRWQIELLFKLWKSLFHIDEWRSQNDWRILTELYARLLSVVMLHWTFLVELWNYPHRSLWKAALCVRHFATCLACSLTDTAQLVQVMTLIQIHFRHIARLTTRAAHPSTAQRLEALIVVPDCRTLN